MSYLYVIPLAMSVICAYTDLRWNLIFDKITLPMALLGIIFSAATGRIAITLLGAAIGFSIFLIGILRGQAGAGDAKMAGALGAWLGLGVLPVIIIACAMGLAWSNIRLQRDNQSKLRIAIFFKGVYRRLLYGKPLRMIPDDEAVPFQPKALPFGVCLAAGACVWIALLSVWQPHFMTIWRL
jgi:prepilin signal peptidase PulO-like enzyme (type II secretory pathway)